MTKAFQRYNMQMLEVIIAYEHFFEIQIQRKRKIIKKKLNFKGYYDKQPLCIRSEILVKVCLEWELMK